MSALKKKFGDSDIGTLSRDLVAKWKATVAREEEERENEESEEVAENCNDDPDPSPEYPVPEYVPTRISTEEVKRESSGEENNREKRDSSKDEEQYSKRSKKKKSHREERSEERESHRSDKSHKHKKDKEREKEKKHKHSEREKDHKRKSSHRDRHREDDVKTKEIKKEKKCDIEDESDQGDKNKHRTDKVASHGKHDNQRELKHASKREEKHSKSKHHDLSSFDMFSKPGFEFKEEKPTSRKRQGDSLEDYSISKHPKLLESSQKKDLPSLPSSFSGTNLIPDISPIYKPLPRTNPFLADDKQKTEGKNDIDLSVLLSSKNKGMSRIYRYICKP